MRKKWVYGIFSLFFLGLLSNGCSKKNGNDARYGIDPAPGMLASSKIDQSFSVEGAELTINKSALDKEFLLQVQETDLLDANQFHSLKSRIVYFIEKNKKIYMMESPVGQVVSQDYNPQLILATFNITKEVSEYVTIDVNTGFSRLYSQAEWHTSDAEGADYSNDHSFMQVGQSFIDQLKVGENNSVVIKQITQIIGSSDDDQEIGNVLVQYHLTPYSPNPNFSPKNNYSFDRFGYFEAAPMLKPGGDTIVRATKYDLQKPIVYAISANTPKDYREAVKAGALYWNKILGENKIQVIDAPAGVSAPSVDYNVIQWMNWDKAGYAYADADIDPRSGEILHSQVYLTSSFIVGGKNTLRAILRRLNNEEKKPIKSGKLKIAGFSSNSDCDIEDVAQMSKTIRKIIDLNLPDDKIKKLSQDYIALVVAHEIGHTLGLRHNFAGSTYASYDSSEGDSIFKDFLKNNQTTATPASSVMDYFNKEDSVMIGAGILANKPALNYDEKAIEHLYFNKDFDNKDIPIFCTDTQKGKFADCQAFDSGKSFVDEIKNVVKLNVSALPNIILENFILFKTSLPEDQQSQNNILKVVPDASKMAKAILAPQAVLAKMLQKDYRILKIDREFPYNSEINQDEILKAQNAYLLKEIQKLGGLKEILEPFGQDRAQFVKSLSEKMAQIISSYKQGTGYQDKGYKLSDEDLNELNAILPSYSAKVFNEMKSLQLKLFSTFLKGNLQLSDVSNEVVNFLLDESERILMTEDGPKNSVSLTVAKKSDKPAEIKTEVLTLELPHFAFSFEQRVLAVDLLDVADDASPDEIALTFKQKGQLKNDYVKYLAPVMDKLENYQLTLSNQTQVAIRWFLEEAKIEKAF